MRGHGRRSHGPSGSCRGFPTHCAHGSRVPHHDCRSPDRSRNRIRRMTSPTGNGSTQPWTRGASRAVRMMTPSTTLTLDLCGHGPFDRALEIGCAEGLFTSLLAPRSRTLLAVDISTRAVRRARARLAHCPNVVVLASALPARYPAGPFDLIVASDVLYYWTTADLRSAAGRIADSLAPGGRFVAIHYGLPVVGVSSGEVAHDVLRSCLPLANVHSERRDIGSGRPYRMTSGHDLPERRAGSTAPRRLRRAWDRA